MTLAESARPKSQILIPAAPSCAHTVPSLLATGRRYQHPAWQRSAPGRVALVLEGRVSGRPAATVAVEAPAMAAECGDRREAHGRPGARIERTSRLQLAAVPKIAATRVPQGSPGDPSRVPGSSDGSPPAGPGRACRGRRQPAPGRREAPAYPSHLALRPPAAREERRVPEGRIVAMHEQTSHLAFAFVI